MSLQTDLRERAAARGTEAADQAAETAQLTQEIRRGRRRRSLVAAAASALCLGLVAYVAIGVADRTSDAPPAGQPSAASGLAVLGDVGPDDLVVTVTGSTRAANALVGPERVLVMSSERGVIATVSDEEVREGLGSAVEDWPVVSLAAVVLEQHLAVFRLDSPAAYVTPHVAVYDLVTGSTVVMDPCQSPLNRFDLGPWCPSQNRDSVQVEGFSDCVADSDGAAPRAAMCSPEPGESYLVTLDPATGEVLSSVALGISGGFTPWVVDGRVLVNTYGTDSGPFLVDGDGNWIQVGGGPAAGLGVVGDRLLIRTSSDVYGAESTYGHVLGLWSPRSGDFEALQGTELAAWDRVAAVDVVH